MPILYVTATPIGNLNDLSSRALSVLKTVDFILCEDTRTTHKILAHFGIKTKLISYHQHSKTREIKNIINLLRQTREAALVCEAGTPGISDPGGKLIETALSEIPELKIVPIPGPSAITAGLSIAGLPADKFIFLGFPPNKKKRKKFFEEAVSSDYTVVFYESPYRIVKSLEDLKNSLIDAGKLESTKVVVCRELTKIHETIYRGGVREVLEEIQKEFREQKRVKGEFVVIIKTRRVPR